jgi:hypothetical protein
MAEMKVSFDEKTAFHEVGRAICISMDPDFAIQQL